MALARWPHLKQLLDESLRRSGADREAYLRDACGGDAELRHEVESLAAAYDDAGAFLEAPLSAAVSGVTRLLSTLDTGGARPRAPGAPETLAAGTLINGRYRIEAIVGEGGMGSVYRVCDTAMSRTVALKTIRGRPQFLNLFKIEFRTLVELRHPHLAQCHDFEPIAGSADYCFTMEFVEGRNILEATEGMGWLAVVDLLVQLCRVLAYVHNRGIVHRDIKATNVLVRADGTVKLVDFGLVGSAGDADHVIGTPAYLTPELIDRGAGDHRSDLYSLGILAYQLICRRLPFSGLTPADVLYQHASTPPRFPDRVDAPGWLQKVILRLCAKLPSDRYRSANQVIEAINSEGNLHHPIETAVTRESYVLSGRSVGRHDEFAALSTFVEQRLAGERGGASAVALVRGQSGIGKSRLLRELRHAVQLNRHTFIEGNCFEGAADEYGALADVIAQLVPLVDARGASELVAHDAAGLATLAPGIGRSRDLSPPPPLVSAEAERLRLIDTVAAFLVDASRVLPYVLYINDLQWAQKGTVDVLGHLHRRVTLDERRGIEVPLAIIGSYRPDETAGRPLQMLVDEIENTATVLSLAPLAPEAMHRLLQSMFGLEHIPASFVGRVLEEAAGSPFFLEEVVRALVENGSVFVESGAWRTATAIGDLEIPASIVATLRRRLGMVVDPAQQHVMRILAAYKKPMSVPLLAAIANLRLEDAHEALRDLTARHMVAAVDGAELYRSAHDRIRTTVYDDLGLAAPALHLQIARALESPGGTPPLSELAHHYWLARESSQALKYALLAGDAALAVYANGEAIEHLEHALALLGPEQAAMRARASEQLADAHFLVGQYSRAKALLMDLNRAADTVLDRTRIQRKLGEVVGYSDGNPSAAVDILWTAARQLGAKRPPPDARFLALTAASLGRHFLQRASRRLLHVATDAYERRRLADLAGIYLRISHLSFFADPRLLFLPVFRAANLVDRLGESKEHAQVSRSAVKCSPARRKETTS